MEGSLEVGANQVRWVSFVVPANATNAKVLGAFRAFGGSGNDIQVIVTDAFNFENWKNSHETQLLYNSEKVTSGVVSVPTLPPGEYVIAFDNRFSAFSRKQVTGSIVVSYLLP